MTVLKAEENRKPVALAEVPPIVVQAILDVEDSAFYEHNGFDVRSTARAFLTNAGAGSIRQGGSTITQQLVKKTLQGVEVTVRIERDLEELTAGATRVMRVGDALTVVLSADTDIDAWIARAHGVGAKIISVSPRHETLEDLFLREVASADARAAS